MYRQLISHSTRFPRYPGPFHAPVASRMLATTPPQSSQGEPGASRTPPPEPGGSNTLIILSSLGALGGLYLYYTRGQPGVDRETARRKEEEVEKKVRQIGEAEKNTVESVARQGQRDYDRAKTTAQDAATAARTRTAEARTDLTDKARQSAQEAHVKFDELKNTAERKISNVRDRSEKIFEEDKEELQGQARNAENKARSWFGWGSK